MNSSIANKCNIKNCNGIGRLSYSGKRSFTRGYCGAHYDKWYTYGDALFTKQDYLENFLSKVIFPEDYINDCWGWTGWTDSNGYGKFRLGDGKRPAHHRASYILLVDDNIGGLDIDHLCRNPVCSNPNHLEAVTGRENTIRGISPPAVNSKKTHCKLGHEFTPDNTWGKNVRICRTCSNRKWREWYHKNKS